MASQAWRCPACRTVVAYEDYETARKGAVFPCRKCGLSLVIDKEAKQPISAPTNPPKPPGA